MPPRAMRKPAFRVPSSEFGTGGNRHFRLWWVRYLALHRLYRDVQPPGLLWSQRRQKAVGRVPGLRRPRRLRTDPALKGLPEAAG